MVAVRMVQKGSLELEVLPQTTNFVSRKERFAVIMQDEAFFVHDTVSGRKYWSPKGRRISVPCTENHRRVTIYGSLALDGRQFFRTYD